MLENTTSQQLHQASNPLVQSRLRALRNERPFSLEPAGMIKGAILINDSAATSLEKVAESLTAFSEPVIWIAEANGLQGDFKMFGDIVKTHVKALIGVGDQAEHIHKELWPYFSYFIAAHTWDEALDMSLMVSKANDSILFSPGCRASEPFQNYKERGAYFNRLVKIKNEKRSEI